MIVWENRGISGDDDNGNKSIGDNANGNNGE